MLKKLILILTLLVVGCAPPDSDLDNFAQCLTDKGAKMYGSMTCSFCKQQRELFGTSFQYATEIECHPRGKNPQTDLCLKMDIKKTPTWILEEDGVEVKRLAGFQTVETLSEFSGCTR